MNMAYGNVKCQFRAGIKQAMYESFGNAEGLCEFDREKTSAFFDLAKQLSTSELAIKVAPLLATGSEILGKLW